MEVTGEDGTRRIDSPFILDEAVFQRWLKLAQNFTTLGGERLAFVMNDILEHKKHKAAHKEGRGRHHPKKKWKVNFFCNFLLVLTTVPSLLFGFRWHADTGGMSFRDIRGHLKM